MGVGGWVGGSTGRDEVEINTWQASVTNQQWFLFPPFGRRSRIVAGFFLHLILRTRNGGYRRSEKEIQRWGRLRIVGRNERELELREMKVAVYGKGGIGKSTTSCNISIALARRGKKVLQIGCDPKHDSTFTLTGFLIPTIIDTLQVKDYHYEDVWPEDVIYKGYGGVSCVEAGGPPAGAGCGGYVVGETVKLLKELNAFYEYDIILFDVLGDVVCGGFAAPLNYADYCIIITDNGFDALFAANRIAASVREKSHTHPLRLAGLVGNRTSGRDLIDKYVEACPMPVLEVLPLVEDIRVSRVKGKTLFEMAEHQPNLNYVCDFYLNIADQILSEPEGIVPREIPDRELFSLLSDFYLNTTSSNKNANQQDVLLDFTII